jgi:hypothetical protein
MEDLVNKFKAKNQVDQWYAKRTLEVEVKKQRKARLPLYKMEVKNNQKIYGACNGNNEWDNTLRGLVPH